MHRRHSQINPSSPMVIGPGGSIPAPCSQIALSLPRVRAQRALERRSRSLVPSFGASNFGGEGSVVFASGFWEPLRRFRRLASGWSTLKPNHHNATGTCTSSRLVPHYVRLHPSMAPTASSAHDASSLRKACINCKIPAASRGRCRSNGGRLDAPGSRWKSEVVGSAFRVPLHSAEQSTCER